MHEHDIDRRTFVKWTGAASGALALAGCTSTDDDENGDDEDEDENETDDEPGLPRFPEIDDPPSVVYLPTHRESMEVLEPVSAGDYRIAPMLSYPHPFWLVTGDDEVERVDPEESRGVHMMVTVWDGETGVVLPVDEGNAITVFKDGEQVGSPQSAWPMISQEMGFHFGDNVPLGDHGTYTVEVDLQPLSVRTTGDLEDRFTDRETATFEFEFDREFQEQVVGGVEYFDEDDWGRPGALEPMDHGGDHGDGEHDHDGEDEHDDDRHEDGDHDHAEIPYSQLPPADAYPGAHLEPVDDLEDDHDLPRSGDAAFVATLLETDSRLADGDGRYLLVSPRTPYNRVPLADMTLHATVERDGEVVGDAQGVELAQTIDGEFDLHYGASLADVQPGDSVTLTIDSPPQVARHQGYDTAFLEMPPIDLEVPER